MATHISGGGELWGAAYNVTAPSLFIVMECMPTTLQEALISGLPTSGYYIPNFMTSEEEARLLHRVVRHTPTTPHVLLTELDQHRPPHYLETSLPPSSPSPSLTALVV